MEKLLSRIPAPRKTFKLFWEAFGSHKWGIGVLILLGFISSVLETLGAAALIPLAAVFVGEESTDNLLLSTISRIFATLGISFSLPSLLIFIVVLFVCKSLILLFFDFVKIHIKSEYARSSMDRLFGSTLVSNWPHLLNQKVGHLETVLKIDIRKSASLLENIAGLAMVLTGLGIFLVAALSISETITVMAFIFGVIIFLILRPLFFYSRKFARETTRMNREVGHYINESISGMKVIKATGSEGSVHFAGKKFFSIFRTLQIKTHITKRLAVIFIQPASIIFIAVVLAFAFYRTSYGVGEIAAIIYLIQRIFAYLQSLQVNLHQMNEQIPYLQSVLEYQRKASKAQEKKDEWGSEPFDFTSSLAFDSVSFSYNESSEILKNTSFSIGKGEMVALVGQSGSGKTTVFDLVTRLFEPDSGSILLDGKEAKEFDVDSWRSNIAYVSQDLFLFDDTIANNIRFYDTEISDEDVRKAALQAHIHDFIETLPNGYDTKVGERGVLLSVGQRQRIVIARALARTPALLLLDEITSALDPETEQVVQESIELLKGDVTIFIIAHRLSTIKNSDRVLVLKEGSIFESRDPETLLKGEEQV